MLTGLATIEEVRDYDKYEDEPPFKFEDVSRNFGFNEREESVVSDYNGAEWPKPFGRRLRIAQRSGNKEKQAQAAADYINHIIATGRVTE